MTTAPPLVTIITPCLNAGKWIEECIMSVRGQSFPRVEHIIVDGGSKDETVSILKKHEGTYNMRWVSERDRNPEEAQNKGMQVASGEIIGVLAADDFLLPWAVETIIQKFSGNPSADLVYGDVVAVPMTERYGYIYFGPPSTLVRTHLRFSSLGTPAVFFRRRVFETLNGFDENVPASDYDFWIRAARQFQFAKVNEVLVCTRGRKESLSSSKALFQSKIQLQLRHYGQVNDSKVDKIVYYSRRVVSIAEWLIRLLAATSEENAKNRRWTNLVERKCVSRTRLLREIPLVSLLSTDNRIQQRIRHGYVDMSVLSVFLHQGE